MSDVLRLPRLAESLTEARIVSWLVAEGALVAPGQAVAEVETDKFTMELEAERVCVIEALLVAEGELVTMGMPIARLGPAPGAPSIAPDLEAAHARQAGREALAHGELRADLSLAAVLAHRSRWRGRQPMLLAYLVLGVGRSLAGYPDLCGARGELGVLVSRGGAAALGVIEGVHVKPLLALEAELRALHAGARCGATAARVVLDLRPEAEMDAAGALETAAVVFRPGAAWWSEPDGDVPGPSAPVSIRGTAPADTLAGLRARLEACVRALPI